MPLNVKIFLHFADLFHMIVVLYSICLNPQTVYRRTFSAVQHTALNKAGIGSLTHFAAKRVNLTHKMSLCSTADRRIAGHIRNIVKRNSEKHGFCAKSCGSKGSLDTCVSRADNRNIIIINKMAHKKSSLRALLPQRYNSKYMFFQVPKEGK